MFPQLRDIGLPGWEQVIITGTQRTTTPLMANMESSAFTLGLTGFFYKPIRGLWYPHLALRPFGVQLIHVDPNSGGRDEQNSLLKEEDSTRNTA